MAKKIYLGNSSVARYCPKCYIGVSNVARKVTKGYIGDSFNKARLCYIAAIGISSVTLNYPTLNVGATVTPTVTIAPTNYDPYTSRTFSITSGSSYATINSSTGALTGKAAGTVTVKVTIVDATGKTITATKSVSVYNPSFTITLTTRTGSNEGLCEYAYVKINDTTYQHAMFTSPTTLTLTAGTVITCTVRGGNNSNAAGRVTVNGTVVAEEYAGTVTYSYIVKTNATINIHAADYTPNNRSFFYGRITITES